jgi:hypothetical protein
VARAGGGDRQGGRHPDADQKLDATGYKQLAHKDKFGKDYAAGGVRY